MQVNCFDSHDMTEKWSIGLLKRMGTKGKLILGNIHSTGKWRKKRMIVDGPTEGTEAFFLPTVVKHKSISLHHLIRPLGGDVALNILAMQKFRLKL